jgi:hypothetical protein
MEKKHTLTQDNGACNDFEKRSVSIDDSALVMELRNFFGWRKDITANRLFKEGSHNFDKFIKYLSEKGY